MMTYMQRLGEIDAQDIDAAQRYPLLLVVEDGETVTSALQPICDFLDIALERIPSEQDLGAALRGNRPMGIISYLDCQGQDGYHVMMTVALHDPSLPIMLLTGNDPVLSGAADAIEELWELQSVAKFASMPTVGEFVDFVFRAGRKGRCSRLMPV